MLAAVAELSSGSTPPRAQPELFCGPEEGGVPWVKTLDLTDGWIDRTDEHLSKAGLGRLKVNEPGTVLIAMYGGFQQIGRTGILKMPATTNQAICALRLRPEVDPEYCNYWLVHARPGWKKIAASSRKDPNVTKDDVGRFEVLVPPLHEQKKIAAILSSVDEAIEATKAVIDQLQLVKKAMMAELLTRGLPGRHTRFKQTEIGEVPEEWEIVPLSEVAFVQTGIAKGKAVDKGVELPYLRVANVQDGRVELAEMKTILVEERSVERYSLKSGDVLFTEGGDADKLGRGCVWRGQIDPCLHQNHVFAVRTDCARLQPEYLAYLAASPGGKAYFLDSAKQTTNLASINSTQLKAFPVPLASLEEQTEIVGAIASVEGRMACEEGCASQLRTLKVALMSVLLTGEVRVKPDEETA